MIPLVGFLPADDPRVAGTVAAIEKTLLRGGFVIRYDTGESKDGLPAGEGAFLACSFWLVSNYVMLGRLEDARKLFDKLAGLANDVGLLAEEYDPRAKRQVGNFPQAFSHLGLITAAYALANANASGEGETSAPQGAFAHAG
jgi:GH15 family glucan-1,4-alpha-glucosidase